eukprot:scaffold212_cov404-Prasinococcus_capsulatus_cf.AAC.9
MGYPCLSDTSRYEDLRRKIGQGSFGTTMLYRDRVSGELVAIKFVNRGENVTKFAERELFNHRLLCSDTVRSPYIVHLKEVILTRTHLAIVMEYADRGELFEFISRHKRLPEARLTQRVLRPWSVVAGGVGVATREDQDMRLWAEQEPVSPLAAQEYRGQLAVHSPGGALRSSLKPTRQVGRHWQLPAAPV